MVVPSVWVCFSMFIVLCCMIVLFVLFTSFNVFVLSYY